MTQMILLTAREALVENPFSQGFRRPPQSWLGLLMGCLITGLAGCSGGGGGSDAQSYTSSGAVRISSLSISSAPSKGLLLVQIQGSGFERPLVVLFGQVSARVLSVNPDKTLISCLIEKPEIVGLADVTVIANGVGSATLPKAFTFLPNVSVSLVSPTSGPVAGGTELTIDGQNFTGTINVTVGGVPASQIAVEPNHTRLRCVTGPSSGTGNADVEVSSDSNGTALGTFSRNAPPTIASISPSGGPLVGGTTVTLTGTGFSGTSRVSIGGVPAEGVSVTNKTQIVFITPASTSTGAKDVIVTSPITGSVTRASGFTYYPVPTITGVTPGEGVLVGGTGLTIAGTDFGGSVTVTIGGVAASNVAVNAAKTEITCNAPASSSSGAKGVAVTSSSHGVATFPDGFTYNPVPTLTGVTPSEGPMAGGTGLTLSGTDFRGTVTVTVGGTVATNVVVNSAKSRITCNSPASGSTGSKAVVVDASASGSVTAERVFTYNPVPTITGVSPASGPNDATTGVTITGSGFCGTVNVWFGTLPATEVVVDSPTQIRCQNPVSGVTCSVSLAVSSSTHGNASLANGFSYLSPATISAPLVPNTGPLSGTPGVTIRGANFNGDVSVSIGANPANVIVVDSTRIVCDVPASESPGGMTVMVTTSNNGTAELPRGYTYCPNLSFTLNQTLSIGSPLGVAVSDMNKDGIPDVATATSNSMGWYFHPYRGLGNGRFISFNGFGSDGDESSLGSMFLVPFPNGSQTFVFCHPSSILFFLRYSPGSSGGYSFDHSTLGIGFSAQSLAYGDLNRDGRVDLVTIHRALNKVSVFLGLSGSSFSSAQVFSLTPGSTPYGGAVGDLNRDGKPDFVVSNSGLGSVSILLGDSTGSLGSPIDVSVGVSPRAVAIADVNRDGTPDLVTANYGSNTISTLIGSGTGSFSRMADCAAGSGPNSVAVVDLNGDGAADVVVADALSNGVSALPGNGVGGFGPSVSLTTSSAPFTVAVTDFNRDGVIDVVAATPAGLSMWGNSTTISTTGTFGLATSSAVDGRPGSVCVGDLNLDGILDLAVPVPSMNAVYTYLGMGTGTFLAATKVNVGTGPQVAAMGDMNRDGWPDLVVCDGGSFDVSVALNDKTGHFGAQTAATLNSSSTSISLGDFDKDGLLDAAVTEPSCDSVAVLYGDGTGGLGARSNVVTTGGVGPTSVARLDFNRDSWTDLVTADSGSNKISLLLNTGNTTPGFQVTSVAVGSRPVSVACGDINRDGYPDVVTADYDSNTVSLLINKRSSPWFNTVTTWSVGLGPRHVAIEDVNRDGCPDIAVACSLSNAVWLLIGNGSGGFSMSTAGVGNEPLSVAFGDVNLDGFNDLVVANRSSQDVFVLLWQ